MCLCVPSSVTWSSWRARRASFFLAAFACYPRPGRLRADRRRWSPGGCAGWVTGAGGDGRALRLALNRTSTGSKVDGGYPSTLRSSGGEPSDGSSQFANRGQFGSRRVNTWCDRPQCPTVHVNQIQHQGNLSRGPLRARIRRAPISGVRKSRPVVSTTHDSRRSADTSPFADQAPELTRPNSTGDFIGRSIARFGRVEGE